MIKSMLRYRYQTIVTDNDCIWNSETWIIFDLVAKIMCENVELFNNVHF